MQTETDGWKRQALDTINAFRIENGDLKTRNAHLQERVESLTSSVESAREATESRQRTCVGCGVAYRILTEALAALGEVKENA